MPIFFDYLLIWDLRRWKSQMLSGLSNGVGGVTDLLYSLYRSYPTDKVKDVCCFSLSYEYLQTIIVAEVEMHVAKYNPAMLVAYPR